MALNIEQNVVQSFSAESSPTIAISASTPGDVMIVMVVCSSASTLVSISDTVNTYVSANVDVTISSGKRLAIWYAPNSGGGESTVTVNFGGASAGELFFVEVSGADTGHPIRSGAVVMETTGAPVTPALAAGAPDDMLLSLGYTSAGLTDVDGDWTKINATGNGENVYLLPGSTGTFTGAFVPSTSHPYVSNGIVIETTYIPSSTPGYTSILMFD